MAILAMESGAESIPLAMLAVFGTAKLLAELFERCKQPGIVGEILAGIGLHLDLLVFANRGTLLLSGIVLVSAVLSKLAGCGLGALGLGRADALGIGAGMAPRGEVGMVVAQIGLGLGVIPASVYAVVVFMAVATTVVAPPLLNYAYRGVVPTRTEDRLRIG
jgi:Kef-type K+ transport system membrane component KefB